MRQEQFWKCVHSMEHIIASKVVLRGGGQTELQCAEILLQRTSTSSRKFLPYNFLAVIFIARKQSLRRLCFYTCQSVHGGGVVSQHALQVSRPTPGGLRGLA